MKSQKIGRLVGIDGSYAQRILRSFDAGDFSWLNSSFRHFEKAFTESEKEMIVNDFLNTHRTFSEHVAKTGIPQGILQAWIRNYNIYGVCMRKHGRPPKDGSNDRISEENQRTGKEASIRAKRDHYLQNVLPGLCRGRDGSSKKRFYEQLANAEDLESLSRIVCPDSISAQAPTTSGRNTKMKKLVDDYIYWFNNQRIQKKLGYLSPVNYRKLAT